MSLSSSSISRLIRFHLDLPFLFHSFSISLSACLSPALSLPLFFLSLYLYPSFILSLSHILIFVFSLSLPLFLSNLSLPLPISHFIFLFPSMKPELIVIAQIWAKPFFARFENGQKCRHMQDRKMWNLKNGLIFYMYCTYLLNPNG